MATAVIQQDYVNFLPMSSILELGGTGPVWSTAIENVRNLVGLNVIEEDDLPGRTDTRLVTIQADDPFVAARVTALDWLVARFHGETATYGVLVCLPTRGKLILHVVSGQGVLKAIGTLATVASHWFDAAAAAERISPHVYFVGSDGQRQQVTWREASGQVMINTMDRPFAGVLQDLVPDFRAPN